VGADFALPKPKSIKFGYPHTHPHFKRRKKVESQTHIRRSSVSPMGFSSMYVCMAMGWVSLNLVPTLQKKLSSFLRWIRFQCTSRHLLNNYILQRDEAQMGLAQHILSPFFLFKLKFSNIQK
jgi:hypothetical protein